MDKSILIFMALLMVAIVGCSSDAAVASRNLSEAADHFEINRRVVYYNSIKDVEFLKIEGRCSIFEDHGPVRAQLEVTCKTGPNDYKKHFLGLSDNVTYFAQQLEGADVSVYHYRVIWKPQVIIPDIELNVGK